MLKFKGEGKDGTVYFFGLNRESIDRLVDGRPINLNLDDLGGPKIPVVILFGETDRMLFNELKKGGYLPAGLEYREPTPETTEVVRIQREDPERTTP